ncbi:MAG: hypothetical protein PHY54_19640 [Methylococcales bacterium]|nr:hypothetical protein [Methylococcales bacterium]
MNGSYDLYPDFNPLYEPTSFSWWLFSIVATVRYMPMNCRSYETSECRLMAVVAQS